MQTNTNYTGHGDNTGGLQRHSVGEMYPYTVIHYGSLQGPLEYAAYDLRTGNEGKRRLTYKEAEIDVYSLKIRNMMHS